ncbi:MAG: FAD-binding oxidoreductase [Polyangiaceae bacterium]
MERLYQIGRDYRALADEIRRRIEGEVRFDDGGRGLYATDASNYRQVPIGVVIPKTVEDVLATVELARAYGAPILGRGGGTSLAGQCCNTAVVIDMSKHLNRIVEIDPKAETATVEPGVILDDLRGAAERYHLTFGPDPATHAWCTLGGMLGNNSCGVHALMAGKTADNTIELDVVTYDGTRMTVGATGDDELDKVLREGGGRARSMRGCGRSSIGMRRWCGRVSRRSRGACRGTTWTSCCRRRGFMWRGRLSARSRRAR